MPTLGVELSDKDVSYVELSCKVWLRVGVDFRGELLCALDLQPNLAPKLSHNMQPNN